MWFVANDTPVWIKPRRTVYFIARHILDSQGHHQKTEHYNDARGRLRTWRTYEAAKVALKRLALNDDGKLYLM